MMVQNVSVKFQSNCFSPYRIMMVLHAKLKSAADADADAEARVSGVALLILLIVDLEIPKCRVS